MLMQEWSWDKALDARYEEGKLDDAKRMLERNFAPEQIAEITLLPVEKIRELSPKKNIWH
jgi:hypothetical protein